MKIQIKHEPIKAVLIYMSQEEANDMQLKEKLKPMFKEWKKQGYFPAVFESGNESLEENMYWLMKINLERIAKEQLIKEGKLHYV